MADVINNDFHESFTALVPDYGNDPGKHDRAAFYAKVGPQTYAQPTNYSVQVKTVRSGEIRYDDPAIAKAAYETQEAKLEKPDFEKSLKAPELNPTGNFSTITRTSISGTPNYATTLANTSWSIPATEAPSINLSF